MRWAILCVGLVAACGSAATVSYDEYAQRFPEAQCDLLVDCGQFPDRATCLATLNVTFADLRAFGPFVEGGTIKFDAARAAACLDVYARLRCSQTSVAQIPRSWGNPRAYCLGDLQCEGDMMCALRDVSVCMPSGGKTPGPVRR